MELAHTTIGCGEQGVPSAQPHLKLNKQWQASRDSLAVTHPTTNLPACDLYAPIYTRRNLCGARWAETRRNIMACSRRAMKRVDIAFDPKNRVVVDQKEFKVGDVTKVRLTKLVGSPRYCFCDSSRTTIL